MLSLGCSADPAQRPVRLLSILAIAMHACTALKFLRQKLRHSALRPQLACHGASIMRDVHGNVPHDHPLNTHSMHHMHSSHVTCALQEEKPCTGWVLRCLESSWPLPFLPLRSLATLRRCWYYLDYGTVGTAIFTTGESLAFKKKLAVHE
jgi:hypothetical protein